MTRRRLLWIVFALALLPSAVVAPSRGRYPELFLGDFDQARAQAAERNAIIVLGVIQEGEETNEVFKRDVWQRAEFAAANEDTITMLVNDGDHRLTKITEELPNGEKIEREVCADFHTERCLIHKRLWNVAYQEFNSDGDMRTPQLIVLSPDGSIHGRLIDEGSLSTNLDMLEDAKKKAGPSLSLAGLGVVKEQRTIAAKHAEAGRHGAAWHSWQRVLAETQTSAWADEARAGVVAALAGYEVDVASARARLEGGEIIPGWLRLVELGEEWAESPLSKEHAKQLRKVEKDKRYKATIEAHKRELEANALWDEVQRLIGEDEVDDARKVARKLIRKFSDTEAAKQALREFPELENG